MDRDPREGLKYVEAVLNYLVDTGEKPAIDLYPPPPGISRRTGRYTTATVPIRDAGQLAHTVKTKRTSCLKNGAN